MRARMAIAVSGVQVRLREVLLRDKPEEMLAASPKGTVPVLVHGDHVIDESLSIMNWALDQNDPENWLGAGSMTAATTIIADNDGPFKHHLDRYKYSTRYKDADREFHRREAMRFIQQLEEQLQKTAFLNGDNRRLADIAIFPFIRQFRIADEAWFDAAPVPRVQLWLNNLTSSDLFCSVMKKYSLWKESHDEYLFPHESPQQ